MARNDLTTFVPAYDLSTVTREELVKDLVHWNPSHHPYIAQLLATIAQLKGFAPITTGDVIDQSGHTVHKIVKSPLPGVPPEGYTNAKRCDITFRRHQTNGEETIHLYWRGPPLTVADLDKIVKQRGGVITHFAST